MTTQSQCPSHAPIDPTWPVDVALILSALEAGGCHDERREQRRDIYHAKASLRLFTDLPDQQQRTLYTRDINHRSMGFLTRDRLPLGYGGIARIPHPENPQTLLEVHCTLLRCREIAPQWYEGAVYFHRDRHEFASADVESDS